MTYCVSDRFELHSCLPFVPSVVSTTLSSYKLRLTLENLAKEEGYRRTYAQHRGQISPTVY